MLAIDAIVSPSQTPTQAYHLSATLISTRSSTLNLDEPAFPSAATSVPVAISSHCVLSAPTKQHNALDASLLQKGHVLGQVRTHRVRGEIRECWEATRGGLTRE